MRKSKVGYDKEKCSVSDCTAESKRAISSKNVKVALPSLKFDPTGKRVYLCKEHYKQFKKATKTKRTLETLTWD